MAGHGNLFEALNFREDMNAGRRTYVRSGMRHDEATVGRGVGRVHRDFVPGDRDVSYGECGCLQLQIGLVLRILQD